MNLKNLQAAYDAGRKSIDRNFTTDYEAREHLAGLAEVARRQAVLSAAVVLAAAAELQTAAAYADPPLSHRDEEIAKSTFKLLQRLANMVAGGK